MRKARRRIARELKLAKVPFILRHKLARKLASGHMTIDILQAIGFDCTDFRGCECCNPRIHQTWVGEFEDRSFQIQTEWNKIVDCAPVQKVTS